MRSRWLVRHPGGMLYRTVGLYTRDEVQHMLCATPVRRIKWWEPIMDHISKTWRRITRR